MYIWNNFLTKLIFFKLFAVNKITKLAFVNLEKELRCFQIIILCLCNSYVLLYYKRYDLYNIIRNIWWSFVRNVHFVQIPWEIRILFWNYPVLFEILDNNMITKSKIWGYSLLRYGFFSCFWLPPPPLLCNLCNKVLWFSGFS